MMSYKAGIERSKAGASYVLTGAVRKRKFILIHVVSSCKLALSPQILCCISDNYFNEN